jgi:NADPH-dependent 2,4-dienoyl-CoA reductase/sulfur reductase-like enzyme
VVALPGVRGEPVADLPVTGHYIDTTADSPSLAVALVLRPSGCPIVSRAIGWIRDNYTEPMRIYDLARPFGTPPGPDAARLRTDGEPVRTAVLPDAAVTLVTIAEPLCCHVRTRAVSVVVIGAGPSGVAMALSLADRGLRPILVEEAEHVGAAWRRRYDRLRLNTAKQFSHLPGRAYPKTTPVFPTRDDVVAHLEHHTDDDRIDLRLGTSVQRIDRRDAGWCVQTTAGAIHATHVVVATGYERVPSIPDWPGRHSFTGELMHSSAYRNPGFCQGKRVLVVGAGSSAMEIAYDVATGGAATAWLSVRTVPSIMLRTLPGGFPSDFIATAMHHMPPRVADAMAEVARRLSIGDLSAVGLSRPSEGVFTRGHRLGRAPAIIDTQTLDAIRNRTIAVVPVVDSIESDRVRLADGACLQPDVIICATGYRRGLEPLVGHLDVLDDRGIPLDDGAHLANRGLWFLGFQSRPGLIGSVAKRSRQIAATIAGELAVRRRETPIPGPSRV